MFIRLALCFFLFVLSLKKWGVCIYQKTLFGMCIVHTCNFLFWGECEAFPVEHGISDWIFRLLPLMKSLCSLGFNRSLRKGNEMESLSTSFDFWTTGFLFFFFLAPVKLVCLKGMWEWLLFFVLRQKILYMMTHFPHLTCIPAHVAVWICAGNCISGRWSGGSRK